MFARVVPVRRRATSYVSAKPSHLAHHSFVPQPIPVGTGCSAVHRGDFLGWTDSTRRRRCEKKDIPVDTEKCSRYDLPVHSARFAIIPTPIRLPGHISKQAAIAQGTEASQRRMSFGAQQSFATMRQSRTRVATRKNWPVPHGLSSCSR